MKLLNGKVLIYNKIKAYNYEVINCLHIKVLESNKILYLLRGKTLYNKKLFQLKFLFLLF